MITIPLNILIKAGAGLAGAAALGVARHFHVKSQAKKTGEIVRSVVQSELDKRHLVKQA